MFRFAFIPIIFLVGGLIFSLLGFVVYRKVKRGLKYTLDKSSEISSQYMDKLRTKEQRKQFPEIVQTGFDDFEIIEETIKKLPPVWQLKFLPLKQKANQLLNDISKNLMTDPNFEHNKLTSLRSFFIHSLDALKQFSQKLQSDHKTLSNDEIERAKENIQLIYNDLLYHERLMQKKRKFEFDVLMDVIKARLKR